MKILHWNIWIKENPENIVNLLKELDPDVACLEELSPGVPEVIEESRIFKDYYYHDAQVWKDRKQGNAIFSKFSISDRSFTYIVEPKSGSDRPGSEGRVYLEVKTNNLTVGTTHLSYEPKFVDNKVKTDEASRLEQIIKTKNENYVLTGDFNSASSGIVLKTIEKYLKNLGPDLNLNTWTTKYFNYNGFEENKLNWRLDHVFGTSDIKVENSEIIKTEFSDHLPILVSFI